MSKWNHYGNFQEKLPISNSIIKIKDGDKIITIKYLYSNSINNSYFEATLTCAKENLSHARTDFYWRYPTKNELMALL